MSVTQSPYTGMETALVPLTGLPLIDILLSGSKWGTGPVGSLALITFGFPATEVAYNAATTDGFYGSAEFSGYLASVDFGVFGVDEQVAVREILQTWSNVANIGFTEVPANTPTAATLRFNYTGPPGLDANSFAASWFPMDVPVAGDTWLNSRLLYPDGWAEGSQNRLTLLHEIGHALGLKHPHDIGLTGAIDGWPDTTVTLPFIDIDTLIDFSTADTVMAYNDLPGIGFPVQADFAPTTPMRLDIAALQYLYGANLAFNAGDTTYTYWSNAHYYETLWDGGGDDTLVADGDNSAIINLTPGSWSLLGLPLTYSERNPDLTIASPREDLTDFGTVFIYDTVVIENATGGIGSDIIIGNWAANRLLGNDGNDVLQGGVGNDILDGGYGVDAAIFEGNHSSYMVTRGAEGWTVLDIGGPDGTDSLANLERLFFADENVALDLDGNAGLVSKLLVAVFSPAALANKTYAGIGLSLLDYGMSYDDLAQLAINVSGASLSNQVVNLLWTNVVGSAPTAEQTQPFVDMLNQGMTTGALTVLAADTELTMNTINLLGITQFGLDYI